MQNFLNVYLLYGIPPKILNEDGAAVCDYERFAML